MAVHASTGEHPLDGEPAEKGGRIIAFVWGVLTFIAITLFVWATLAGAPSSAY